ncbi:MAG TPA: hypothetical protein PLX89_23920 [Verrucomicrobiota bacterium]|nr:hypothetical protein [Verrucomicrobiales bacterium]HRI16057.1 hypothetical protein [Verrucomicrobiota bacterium]
MKDRPYPRSIPPSWRTRFAFEIRGRKFTWHEVVCAAEIRGDLAPLVEQGRYAQACEERASTEGGVPDMGAVEAMMDEFRYARSLVTVEETERWLDAHGLTVDDLSDHFLRRYWLTAGAERTDEVSSELASLPDVWPADLLISGTFVRLTRAYAREALCAARHQPPAESAAPILLSEFRRRRGFDLPTYAAWREEWELADSEVVGFLFGQQSLELDQQQSLTIERRTNVLTELRTGLVRMELVIAEFDSEAAAHEAHLCVTSDGRTLEDVANETGFPIRQESAFVREFPESWHLHLLGALPGRTLPPLPNDATFDVCRVVSSIEPQLTDAAVVAAVDAVLLERQFGHLESQEVRWHINVEIVA